MTTLPTPQHLETPVKRCAYCGHDLLSGQFHTESEVVSSLRSELATLTARAEQATGWAALWKRAAKKSAHNVLRCFLSAMRMKTRAEAERDDAYKALEIIGTQRDVQAGLYALALQQHEAQEKIISDLRAELEADETMLATLKQESERRKAQRDEARAQVGEIARKQMERDCAAVCHLCRDGDTPTEDTGLIESYPAVAYYHVEEHGDTVLCNAAAIRAAYAAAQPSAQGGKGA